MIISRAFWVDKRLFFWFTTRSVSDSSAPEKARKEHLQDMNFIVALLVVGIAVFALAVHYRWVFKYSAGLLPLSGDPVTYGHLDIIKRAAKMCHILYVVIGVNPGKKPLFSPDERVNFAKRLIEEAGISNVVVLSYAGLQIDLSAKLLCKVVFRGVRNAKDKDFETEQAMMSALCEPGFYGKIRFLRSRSRWNNVSSTVVREYARYGSVVNQWTAAFIEKALYARLGWWRVRIMIMNGENLTTETSALASKIVAALRERGLKAHHLSFKDLRDAFLTEKSPAAEEFRTWLSQTFGRAFGYRGDVTIELIDSKIDDPAFWQYRQEFDARLREHVSRLYREALAERKGILIFTWSPSSYTEGMGIKTSIMLHNCLCLRANDNPDKNYLDMAIAAILDGAPTDFLEGAKLPKPTTSSITP